VHTLNLRGWVCSVDVQKFRSILCLSSSGPTSKLDVHRTHDRSWTQKLEVILQIELWIYLISCRGFCLGKFSGYSAAQETSLTQFSESDEVSRQFEPLEVLLSWMNYFVYKSLKIAPDTLWWLKLRRLKSTDRGSVIRYYNPMSHNSGVTLFS
jgi:hypothetical protein